MADRLTDLLEAPLTAGTVLDATIATSERQR